MDSSASKDDSMAVRTTRSVNVLNADQLMLNAAAKLESDVLDAN